MLQPLSEDELHGFRELMEPSIRELVREARRVEDVAELELMGADLVPAALLTGPPGVAAEFVAMVGEAKGGRSLLRAISAAAPPPISRLAADADARLGQGPLSLAAQRAGTLVPDRAFVLDADEPVTSVLVACGRPGTPDFQILGCTFEWPETGGAIKDALVTRPLAEDELEPVLLEPAQSFGVRPEEISTEDALERVAAGAARSAEVGLGPEPEALPALCLLLRAGGRTDADELLEPLPGLPVLAEILDEAWESDDGPEPDEKALSVEIDLFDAALDAWCAGRDLDEERRDLVTYAGHTMADFQAWYAGGDMADWSSFDLGEYLLDFVPRKVGIEDGHVEVFPEAVTEVLRFLAATGRLEADAAEELRATALDLTGRFIAVASDPSNFGVAKAMTTAMLDAGIDVADQASIERWIGDFNALPEEERHRRVPAFARPIFMLPSPPTPPARSAGGKRKTKTSARKTQRQARKRNRRS